MNAPTGDAWLAERFATMLDASGVTDFEIASMRVLNVDGVNHVSVLSTARGRVEIGTFSSLEAQARLGDALEDAIPWIEYLESAVAKMKRDRTKPAMAKKRETRAANIARARQLRREGLSPAQIAVKMTQERGEPQRPPIAERSVWRWLEDEKG